MLKFIVGIIVGAALVTVGLSFAWPPFNPKNTGADKKPNTYATSSTQSKQEQVKTEPPKGPTPTPPASQESSPPSSPATTTQAAANGQFDSPVTTDSPGHLTTTSSMTANSNEVTQPPPKPILSPDIQFIIQTQGEKERAFSDWPSASSALDQLPRNLERSFSFSVRFAPSVITQSRSEDEFRNWLTGVGEYIFARRIILVKDLVHVIRNSELRKAKPCDTSKHGCALFNPQEHLWEVKIRGLENYPQELKQVVEKIMLPALKNPTTMARYKPLKTKKISEWLKGEKIEITNDQIKIVDAFLKLCTLLPGPPTDNLSAFLPAVCFEELPSADRQKIIDLRSGFLKRFNEQILVSAAQAKASHQIVEKINDDHYVWLTNKLRQWVQGGNISDLVLRSLFDSVSTDSSSAKL